MKSLEGGEVTGDEDEVIAGEGDEVTGLKSSEGVKSPGDEVEVIAGGQSHSVEVTGGGEITRG